VNFVIEFWSRESKQSKLFELNVRMKGGDAKANGFAVSGLGGRRSCWVDCLICEAITGGDKPATI
jgi:hypothetical protein